MQSHDDFLHPCTVNRKNNDCEDVVLGLGNGQT